MMLIRRWGTDGLLADSQDVSAVDCHRRPPPNLSQFSRNKTDKRRCTELETCPSGPAENLSNAEQPSFKDQAGAVSDLISIRQPVSRAASRAFCPSRPMASDS
jgi:hypothetical protein